MCGHGDQRSRIRGGFFEDDVFRSAFFNRACYVAARKGFRHAPEVFEATSLALCRHSIEMTGSREVRSHFSHIESANQLYRSLEVFGQGASVGQNFFCRLGSVQRYQYFTVHRLLLVYRPTPALIVQSTLTLISLALASSVLGSRTSRIPFLKLALTLSAWTSLGSSTVLMKLP